MLSQLRVVDLPLRAMPHRERKAAVPAFGRVLKSLREKRFKNKLTSRAVADRLKHAGVQTTGGSIRGYESGWNKAIDPVVLDALAELYRVPVSGLIAALKANRENPDLSDFEVEQILRSKARAHDAQAVALSRFQEIGQRLAQIGAELDDFAIESADLIAQAATPAEPRRQTTKTRNGPPERHPHS